MKLFLASSSETLPLVSTILPNKGKGAKVIFIANASDNYTGDKWWVTADRKAFEEMGCEIRDIDLRTVKIGDFSKLVSDSDAIHFCGGSVLYLISIIRKFGIEKLLVDAVRGNKLLYTGTSAGSMIASADLKLSSYDDEDKEYAKEMNDFSGLGLVDFLVVPHTNSKDFLKSNHDMLDNLAENLQTLIFIHDKQAILVEDGQFKVVHV